MVEFNLSIQYKPGTANIVADALSRFELNSVSGVRPIDPQCRQCPLIPGSLIAPFECSRHVFLEPEELRWKLVHAFKAQAKIELSRAHNKKLRAAQRIQSQESSDGAEPVCATIKIWHHPPFIEMTADGVSMGDLFFHT